jgi:hypothetical protein
MIAWLRPSKSWVDPAAFSGSLPSHREKQGEPRSTVTAESEALSPTWSLRPPEMSYLLGFLASGADTGRLTRYIDPSFTLRRTADNS